MSVERNIVTASMIAKDDWAAYKAVRPDGKLTAATGDPVYGLVYGADSAAKTGEPGTLVTGGEYIVYVDVNVAAGDLLTGGASGNMTISTIGTDNPFAMALESASAGQTVRVKILA